MNAKSTFAYAQGLQKPFYQNTPNPQAYQEYKIGNKSIPFSPYQIKDSNAIYDDKGQKTGYKVNPIGNALNDYAGHLFNSDGSPLINSNYLSGSGAKFLGQGLTNMDFGETGAALANSPYLSGNAMQALGQGLTDVGLTGMGSTIGGAASSGSLLAPVLNSIGSGLSSAASTVGSGLGSAASGLGSAASSIGSQAASLLKFLIL